ncbi:hypothetical protein [Butyricimonas muris]|uniref:hypothetical protein n=1 Tax=Butyricimonas muris TaxID=3378067 RepID=UPI003966C34C
MNSVFTSVERIALFGCRGLKREAPQSQGLRGFGKRIRETAVAGSDGRRVPAGEATTPPRKAWRTPRP